MCVYKYINYRIIRSKNFLKCITKMYLIESTNKVIKTVNPFRS